MNLAILAFNDGYGMIKRANVFEEMPEQYKWGLGGLGVGALGTLGIQYLLKKKQEEDAIKAMEAAYDPYSEGAYSV